MDDFTKAYLRRVALNRRLAVPAAEVGRRSEALGQHLFGSFPVARWRWLSVFLPLARRHEPDTWFIIRRIWAERLGVRLAVPVVQADGVSLKHYELRPDTPLLENRWGIPEPDATKATEVLAADFDTVLVPLLAVDQAGHRVGYGGGFYDRFLAQCGPRTQFVGLNLLDEPPLARIAGVLPTDVALHACITPHAVWRF
jgi:5-formyltetrahydrofolate cyclo-ligase